MKTALLAQQFRESIGHPIAVGMLRNEGRFSVVSCGDSEEG